MLTRCPHCQTSFRVTSEQLKLRQGQVRCGECLGVFNALESLADEAVPVVAVPAADSTAAEIPETPIVDAGDTPPEAVAELEPESAAPVEETPAVADEMPLEEPSDESPEEPVAALVDEPVEPPVEPPAETPIEEAAAEPAAEPDEASAAVAELPDETPAEEAGEESAGEPSEEPAETTDEEELPSPRRWPWIAGSLLLVLLALGQLAFIYRVELAVLSPGMRPALVDACALFGCEVPRPRKPELASIESSDLAPEDKDRLLLTATLKNRAPFVQEYPHLELTLTDTHDAAILRKVLAPADYLPADLPPAAGFAMRGEVAVKLLLDAKGVPAVGYRLYLFYP